MNGSDAILTSQKRRMARMLHIHNGDSSAGTARESIPGQHFAWREALVCGPVPAGLDGFEWRQIRADHLANAYDLKYEDCERDLREQEEALRKFRDHEEVILWFEHDLFCQINLLYLLNWFAQQQPGKTKLSLICIDEFPGIEDFRGLGQLTTEQLASLLPRRREITADQFALAVQAWSAYTAADPTEIEALVSSDTAALPFLENALRKHLQRFPSVRNGLGRIENLGLELIASGQSGFVDLFWDFGKLEPTYGYGDAQFFLELKRLTMSAQPLLTNRNAAGASALPSQSLSKSSFQITEIGKSVFRGDEDFVRLNKIDMWVGGVHLKGKEASWRWDDSRNKLVASARNQER
jgi:hypothetical protein